MEAQGKDYKPALPFHEMYMYDVTPYEENLEKDNNFEWLILEFNYF